MPSSHIYMENMPYPDTQNKLKINTTNFQTIVRGVLKKYVE
jgi:hypothetical protein